MMRKSAEQYIKFGARTLAERVSENEPLSGKID